ncbi:hypothetical protein MTR67_030110 [Solanum verrucosum]|uniref:Uncharacterized protein n=1 Tax=Solanum verrucosum TaxID=315347 RepID=A0AAF0R9B8_SOLVR|nr:hypothetical protein MTR67_030110 [Solanum verrucosum]
MALPPEVESCGTMINTRFNDIRPVVAVNVSGEESAVRGRDRGRGRRRARGRSRERVATSKDGVPVENAPRIENPHAHNKEIEENVGQDEEVQAETTATQAPANPPIAITDPKVGGTVGTGYLLPSFVGSCYDCISRQIMELSLISSHRYTTLLQSHELILLTTPQASGRFASDGQSINCHDEGVLYIKAKVDSQFCDLLNDAQKDIDLALNFCPKINRSVSNLCTTPLVVVEVTEFACGIGIALSMSTEHAVIDGFIALKFIYEWSKVSKMGINIHSDKINCFTFDDFGTIFPPISDNHLLKRVKSPRHDHYHDFAEMVAKRFVINLSAISKLRENVGVVYFKPSRVELVIAFLWRTLINISQPSKFHEEIQEWEGNEQVDVCMASSLCRFPITETDFGWGKPCLLSFGLRRSDMFWLYDTPCGTGIIVQADLKTDYMDMFGCDKDVLSFICDE